MDQLCDANEMRVLVLIDGLDEATGWRFDPMVIPADLPAHLRFVLSARQQLGDHGAHDWIERLDWHDTYPPVFTPHLPKMDAARIGDVHTRMGCPISTLSTNVDVTAELVRLTEGEPFLVRYYAEVEKRIFNFKANANY